MGSPLRREQGSAFQCRRLTEQSSGPHPLSQRETVVSVLNICLIHRGGQNTQKSVSRTADRTENTNCNIQKTKRRQFLGYSNKCVIAIARQRPLYYCVCVGRSKFSSLAYFPCFEKIKVGLYDQIALCLCVYPALSSLRNGSVNMFTRQ
jgi:hypothetical protein